MSWQTVKKRKRGEERRTIGQMCHRQALFWTRPDLIPISITLYHPFLTTEEVQAQEPLGRLTTQGQSEHSNVIHWTAFFTLSHLGNDHNEI